MEKKPVLPYHLRAQLGETEPLLESERCRPGVYGFVAAHSQELDTSTELEVESKTPGVGYCFDGSFLPIRNGCSHTLYNLMQTVGHTGGAHPYFIVCDRGVDRTEAYFGKEFSTVFISPEDYYGGSTLVQDVFRRYNIMAAQFYSSEGVLNLAPRLRENGVRTIFEIQNTDYQLLAQLNASTEEVNAAYERQIAAQQLSDVVFARSVSDASEAIKLGMRPEQVLRYQGAINTNEIKFRERDLQQGRLVFLGHLYYEPNQRAVEHLIDSVLPQLDKHYQLTVIGVGPDNLLERYRSVGITVKSDVDELGDELLEHDIAVAPLTEGSGTRLKLLEFLASGLPTITTSVGVEGLEDAIYDHVLVEDDIHSYPRMIAEITTNPVDYIERSKAGRVFVENRYSWDKAVTAFTDLYEAIQVGRSL